jgi:diguanylate cyclase (GGDEF)-like protein/PAS domain S-box-containing protein
MPINLLLSALPAIAALLSASAAFLGWRRRETPGARSFSLFCACIAIWCFFSIFELLSLPTPIRLTLARFQYCGLVYFPILWVIFTLEYTHQDKLLSRPFVRLLGVLPTISLILALTDHWHGLIWKQVTIGPSPAHPDVIFQIEHGWWFNHVLAPHQYLMFLLGVGILLYAFFTSSALYRRQIPFLLGFPLIPLALNVPYVVADISLYGLDLTPFGLSIGGIILQLGLFKGRILDLSPISYRTIFLNSAEAMILLDKRCQVVDLNPSAYAETPHQSERLIGRPFQWAFPDYCSLIRDIPRQESTQILAINRHGSAKTKEVKVRSLNSVGGRSVGWAIIIRDVTLAYQRQSELRRIAYLDELTGLCNRRQLDLTATQVLSPASQRDWPIALIYLDLNAFKPINDTYGHDAGDRVLIHVAHCLKKSVRNRDLVVRLGGDEFVALLFQASRSVANDTSDRIQDYLREPLEFAGKQLQVGASLGVACFPEDGQTLGELLHVADQDMYRHKPAH